MKPDILETTDVKGYYDYDYQVCVVVYRGTLTQSIITIAYQWLDQLMTRLDTSAMRGRIMDFRQVSDFQLQNLSVTRLESRNLAIKHELEDLPTALIVKTMRQEQMVGLMLNLSPQQRRKRIVKSTEEALEYIDQRRAMSSTP